MNNNYTRCPYCGNIIHKSILKKHLNLHKGKMRKKGQVNQIMILVILTLVIVGIMGIFWMYSMVAPIVSQTAGTLTDELVIATAGMENEGNMSGAVRESAGIVTNSLPLLNYIGYFMFFMLILGFFLMAFFVRTYPFLIIFWIGLIFLLVLVALIMSNAYQVAADTGEFSSAYSSFTMNDYVMRYLPHMIAVTGIFGGIILFVLVTKDPVAEEVVI
jgi:uncharacterized protein (UPF0333 family)